MIFLITPADMTRARLEIPFKPLGFPVVFEPDDHQCLPGPELGSVGRLARVVIIDALLEVRSSADIALAPVGFALQQLDVRHIRVRLFGIGNAGRRRSALLR